MQRCARSSNILLVKLILEGGSSWRNLENCEPYYQVQNEGYLAFNEEKKKEYIKEEIKDVEE